MINKTQENILKYAKVMQSTQDIAKVTKLQLQIVENAIVTLARKNYLNKQQAKALLVNSPMIKWLDRPTSGGLKKPLPVDKGRTLTTYC